jgi:hypothetical protein
MPETILPSLCRLNGLQKKSLFERHGFRRTVKVEEIGLQSVCEDSISKLSPAGTAELSPGR